MEIKGRQVKVGIEAPLELIIHREEIYAKVLEENKLAANSERCMGKKITEHEN